MWLAVKRWLKAVTTVLAAAGLIWAIGRQVPAAAVDNFILRSALEYLNSCEPSDSSIYGRFFLPNGELGWGVRQTNTPDGKRYSILHTSSAGCHWRKIFATGDPAFSMTLLRFSDPNHGWMTHRADGRKRRHLLFTSDGGHSWSVGGDYPDEWAGVYFLDEKTGWGIQDTTEQCCYLTRDGGQTWALLTHEEQLNGMGLGKERFLTDVWWQPLRRQFYYHQYQAGLPARIKKSAEERRCSLGSLHLYKLNDTPLAWRVRAGGLLERSSDNCATWEQIDTVGHLVTVSFNDIDNGWAILGANEIAMTRDGGQAWETRGTVPGAQEIYFLDDRVGWVISKRARPGELPVWMTRDSANTWTQMTVDVIADNFGLDADTFREKFSWEAGKKLQMLSAAGIRLNLSPTSSGFDNPIRAQLAKLEVFTTITEPAHARPSLGSMGSAIDATHAWVVDKREVSSDVDTLLFTEDGGRTWSRQRFTNGLWFDMGTVFFVDSHRGSLGNFQTCDGGKTWLKVPPGATAGWEPLNVEEHTRRVEFLASILRRSRWEAFLGN